MDIASRLAKRLKPGDIVCLFGDLGSGKTVFTKGLAKGLGISPRVVSSPTYVLLNIYEKGRIPLYHFDLYRLDKTEELFLLGFEEFLYGEGVSAIEWAEKLGPVSPEEYLGVQLKGISTEKREILFQPNGQRYRKLIGDL